MGKKATKKTTTSSNNRELTKVLKETDEIFEFHRYHTTSVDSSYYEKQYSIKFKRSTTAHFEFSIRRDGKVYLCSIPSKVMKEKFTDKYRQLNDLKGESVKKIQEEKQRRVDELEENVVTAAKISMQAIHDNPFANISVGDDQTEERPATPTTPDNVFEERCDSPDIVDTMYERFSDDELEDTNPNTVSNKRGRDGRSNDESLAKRQKFDKDQLLKEVQSFLTQEVEKLQGSIYQTMNSKFANVEEKLSVMDGKIIKNRDLSTTTSAAVKDERYPWIYPIQRPDGRSMSSELYVTLHRDIYSTEIGGKWYYNVFLNHVDKNGKVETVRSSTLELPQKTLE